MFQKQALRISSRSQNLLTKGKRGYFWSKAPPPSTAKLLDLDQQLKIDQYRGQLEDFLQEFQKYEEYLGDTQKKIDFKKDELIPGKCTVEGTQRFKERAHRENQIPLRHFRKPMHVPLELTSIGIGTYIGPPDDQTDFDVYNAIKLMVLSGGVNVIDTAINYRCQKAERTVGAAMKTLVHKYGIKRDEMFVCSKNGYIPDDSDSGIPATTLIQDMIDQQLITKEDVAAGIHCMHPKYLENQLNQSKKNLGLETIDLMYIHNAYETQAHVLKTNDEFYEKLKKVFEFYESKIQSKEIQYYGMATWLCFRAKPEEDKIYLNLQKCIELAEQIGGKDKHGFKFIQVPMGVGMPEAFVNKWQEYVPNQPAANQEMKELKVLVAICNLLKMNLIASKPIMEGRVGQIEIPQITNITDTISKHIQLVRSMPIRCQISTLVGMKKIENLKKNFEVIKQEPLTKEEFQKIMKLQ